MKKLMLVLMLVLGLISCESSFAADFKLVSEGNAVYSLQGFGLQGVGGVDVTVYYDSSSFGTPQVSQGALASGSFFASNSNQPGQIRIALVHATGLSGNGALASISFSSASKTGAVPVLKVNTLIDTKGSSLAASASVNSQSSNRQSSSDFSSGSWREASQHQSGQNPLASSQQSSSTSSTPSPLVTAGAVAGTITIPQDFNKNESSRDSGKTAAAEPPIASPTVQTRGSIHNTADQPAVKKEPKKFKSVPASVIERFYSYQGERSAKGMSPLFFSRGGEWISQSPEIAVADGKSELLVTFTPGWISGESPSFALKGLSMKKLNPSEEAAWEISAIPNEGVVKASIAIELEEASASVTLTVVPPLPARVKGVKLSEKEVNAALSSKSDSKPLVWDLNGDGKRDYIDDYILIGHYILNKKSLDSVSEKKSEIKK